MTLADVIARSGQLNAKRTELLALQAQARARLAKTRANFADGMKAAKETQQDLEWTQKKVRYVCDCDRQHCPSRSDQSKRPQPTRRGKVPRSVPSREPTVSRTGRLLESLGSQVTHLPWAARLAFVRLHLSSIRTYRGANFIRSVIREPTESLPARAGSKT